MKKMFKLSRRIIHVLVGIIFSINTFGAIVSDNDGSAFITKAEYDSLRNDFQAQIDSYNKSIDSKIDEAISAYLVGVKISNTFEFELPTNESFIGKVTWGDIGFSSKIGSKALTIPNKNFLVGQDETYCGLTWDLNLDGTSTKVSEGGFDLSYKPEYVMGYMQEYGADKQLYLDSWGKWKPYFFAAVTAYFKSAHSSDDSGSNPEWYGFMRQTGSSYAASLTGAEWNVKPKKNATAVTRWTMVSETNNKWERGYYCDDFSDSKDDLIFYPLSEQKNQFRNYKEGKRMILRDGFSHKLTDVYRSSTNGFIQNYPWSTTTASLTNLDLGNENTPARTMTPYLDRLKSDPSSVTEDKYKYKWLNLTYKNWTKSMMTSSWPSWTWHGGPYTNMGWFSVDTTNNDNFSEIKSKEIKLKTDYLTELVKINQGIAIWKNIQTDGELKVTLNMSEAGHVILYVGSKPDATWGGTSNKLGGRERDYTETEDWTVSALWKNNTNNTISKETNKTFKIDKMKKNDILFFMFLPDDSTKVAKINSMKLVLTSE